MKNGIDKLTGDAAAAISSASTCESATNLTPAWTRVRVCGARHGLFRAKRGVGYLFVVQWSRSDAPHFNLGPYSPALKHPAARVQHDHLASLWERLMQLER